MKKKILLFAAIAVLLSARNEQQPREIWTKEQAHEWYKQWGWLRGCNFIPSTAVNQLEMWQADTFDPTTIDRELGWAEDIGMNCMRVYLHHVAWETDKAGFKKRMKQYLDIADKHHISTIFVIFDDCWNATYAAGKQPDPKPGVHNSGWLRDPGDLLFQDTTIMVTLETYAKDVLATFAKDKRIILWDLYNEVGNSGYGTKSMPLLQKAFLWARTVNPSQPLSAGVFWFINMDEINKFILAHSDVVTYHNYGSVEEHQQLIDSLKQYGRPMICTEYMMRPHSTVQQIMPMLKRENIGAINWGLVAGKTNTIFGYNQPMPDVAEPPVWLHDIFRKDGTPFSEEEVSFIKRLTQVKDNRGDASGQDYILTPPPAPKPRINGAKITGASASKPFLFTIAATGDRPMKFAARNLPEGLSLDANKGIITGSCAKEGAYIVPVTASNTKKEYAATHSK
jgi:hypothetical protein